MTKGGQGQGDAACALMLQVLAKIASVLCQRCRTPRAATAHGRSARPPLGFKQGVVEPVAVTHSAETRCPPRTDAAMWLKRYSGLLRLHAALLSPAGEFLPRLENSALDQRQSSLRRSSTFLFSPRRPTPRTPFTFYTTGTATRCTVQATPLCSLIPVPQFTLS